ncbi:MAG: hypothetical protein KC474_09525 [Cyanobacteria bacterium HKST-UBA04]|nr:hypothetical protein [Cyanobacteria bacterium HKST-UBA04]MCA9841816.1 hypothetical protein [Cyanobacteria bacterium HKST-UBA03]
MKRIFSLFAAGIALTGLTALNAQAVVSYDVQPGDNPTIELTSDQEVLLHIPRQQYYNYQISFRGDDGLNFTVPLHTQDTYYFDATKAPSRQISYTVKTLDGQQVANGTINNPYVYTSRTDISSILNQRTTYDYSAFRDEEPTYNTSRSVRGYW